MPAQEGCPNQIISYLQLKCTIKDLTTYGINTAEAPNKKNYLYTAIKYFFLTSYFF